jgi:hypothetical protein
LEVHLKGRLGELFKLDYDLLLYDMTSTYFEGQADGNPLAARGYSRAPRPDCKQVTIALVVSRCGMPLGYEVFAGNRSDVTTGDARAVCRAAGLGDEPRRVLEELGRIRQVDVLLPTREGVTIRRRCITRPTDHQAILLQRLGLSLPSRLRITDLTEPKM